ncbi:MAG: UDP-glucose--hexose-1-phosphate uridylyltransferase [Oscillospiraceae bacterium]|nr:UDP-glucose--hexose-1-phosphate uridylyltransferase [Oscillospiraceae bacterium]
MIYEYIDRLVDYGLKTELITPDDVIFTRNSLLDTLKLSDYTHEDFTEEMPLEEILKNLLDYACEQQLIGDNITERDLFDTRLMACLTPRPSEIISKFRSLYDDSPKRATDWFYKFSRDTDYIRRYRIAKDMKWKTSTKYGEIDITINLSKPEKDPKAIAAAKNAKASGYPKCLLCPENVGYAGRLNHPARNNHRIIPLTINGTQWGLQYSPYVYYNEHCILFNCEHTPMVIDRSAFRKLFDFIGQFPHYFIGSNADLPIVGGSILSHEHFQGGCYEFPLERAEIEKTYTIKGFEDVEVGRVKWAMSVIRIRSENSDRLVELADKILTAWRGYTDEEAFIFAETDGEPHNTITPIARMKNGKYELDLVLRNNITTDEHPLGVYHPHADLHHIKKENIGLIEVMGLAVLPARLKGELEALSDTIINKGYSAVRTDPVLEKHADWAEEFASRRDITPENIDDIIKDEVGKVFERVLEDAGVYKYTPEGIAAFERFISSIDN